MCGINVLTQVASAYEDGLGRAGGVEEQWLDAAGILVNGIEEIVHRNTDGGNALTPTLTQNRSYKFIKTIAKIDM